MIDDSLARRRHLEAHLEALGSGRELPAHEPAAGNVDDGRLGPDAPSAPTTGTGNAARVFRHRNYRLFFGSQLVSLIGTWMQTVAQAWLVLDLTGDAFVLGLATAMQFLPVLVFGLFGGLIADALPKRRTLIVTQIVQMLLAFSLFVLTASGRVEVWQIPCSPCSSD